MKTRKKQSFLTSFKFKMTLLVMIMVLSVVTVSYGFFLVGESQSGVSTIESSCFNTTFTEGESINFTNAMSVSDTTGQNSKPYTFTITNTCDLEAKYTVLLNVKTGSFDDSHINLSLNKYAPVTLNTHELNTSNIPTGYTNSYILQSGSLKKNGSVTYDLRLWINSATTYEDVQGKNWEGQIKVITTPTKIVFNVPQAITAMEKGQVPDGVNTGTPNFAKATTTTESDVYALQDDYGTSYYYRGNVKNNYVKFAGFYWRIVRINGDGTVRIAYDGTSAHENSDLDYDRLALKNVAWNTNYNDNKYAGYMFGGSQGETSTSKEQAQKNETSSEMKIALENWFKEKIIDQGYDDRTKIADRIFCNDRSTASSVGEWNNDNTNDWGTDSTLGYGNNSTFYGAMNRFKVNYETSIPTFKCNMNQTVKREAGIISNDAFTAEVGEKTKGNGDLDYPIGLLTADEVVASGIPSSITGAQVEEHYLYGGQYTWLLSPGVYYVGACMFSSVVYLGIDLYVGSEIGVVPVINLTAEYAKTLKGTGEINNPYTAS